MLAMLVMIMAFQLEQFLLCESLDRRRIRYDNFLTTNADVISITK